MLDPGNAVLTAVLRPMMMILPPSVRWGADAWIATKTPRTFVASIRSKSSRANVSTAPRINMPALTTRTLRRPKRATVCATASLTASWIRAVGLDHDRRNAQRLCCSGGLSCLIRRFDIGQGDRRAVRSKLFHDRSANASRSTEYKRDFIRKPRFLTHHSLHY